MLANFIWHGRRGQLEAGCFRGSQYSSALSEMPSLLPSCSKKPVTVALQKTLSFPDLQEGNENQATPNLSVHLMADHSFKSESQTTTNPRSTNFIWWGICTHLAKFQISHKWQKFRIMWQQLISYLSTHLSFKTARFRPLRLYLHEYTFFFLLFQEWEKINSQPLKIYF